MIWSRRGWWTLGIGLVAVGCANPDEVGQEVPADSASGEEARVTHQIHIRYDASLDEIVVHDMVECGPDTRVEWTSSPADAMWVVAFPDGTPLRRNRSMGTNPPPASNLRRYVFMPDSSPGNASNKMNGGWIPESEASATFKYSIMYPVPGILDDGTMGTIYKVLDPKLVIQNNMIRGVCSP